MLRKSLPLLAILAISLAVISAAVVYENARAATSISAEAVDIASLKTDVENNISAGKMADAKAQFKTLLANADADPEVVPAIYDLAEKFRFANNFETALQGHQYILDNYPDHKDAILAQKSLAATYIWAGDIKNAEVVTDELYQKFADNELLSESAFWVADTYYWRNFFKPAQKYYDKVIETFPGTKAAMSAQRAIATMCMAQGDEEGAQSAIDAYMANYGHMEGFAQEMMLIAGRYGWDKKFEKAFEYYDYIAKYYPASDFGKLAGLESGKAKVKMFMNAGDEPNAIIAIDEFIAKYAKDDKLKEVTKKNPDYASFDQSLMEITKQLGWEKRYDSALKYYDYMSANFADETLVADASLEGDRLRVIRIEDTLDEPNSLIAIDEFIVKHAEHARVAEVTLEFAQYYDWKNDYEPNEFTDLLLYKVIEEFNDTPSAVQAQLCYDIVDLREDIKVDDANVGAIVGEFIDGHAEVPGIFVKLSEIVERYYLQSNCIKDNTPTKLDHSLKVIKIGEQIVSRTPVSHNNGEILYLMGDSYRVLNQDRKAIECYQKIFNKWPGYRSAGMAGCHIGHCYYNMMSEGKLTFNTAEPLIKKSYKKVIENYEGSSIGEFAQSELDRFEYHHDYYNALYGGEK